MRRRSTDEQVKDDYDKNKRRYTTPETRTIEQLVFKTPDAAKAALEFDRRPARPSRRSSQAEGKTLADMLLGTLAKDKIPDPAVADAAFELKSNEVSQVVAGRDSARCCCASPRSRPRW